MQIKDQKEAHWEEVYQINPAPLVQASYLEEQVSSSFQMQVGFHLDLLGHRVIQEINDEYGNVSSRAGLKGRGQLVVSIRTLRVHCRGVPQVLRGRRGGRCLGRVMGLRVLGIGIFLFGFVLLIYL